MDASGVMLTRILGVIADVVTPEQADEIAARIDSLSLGVDESEADRRFFRSMAATWEQFATMRRAEV